VFADAFVNLPLTVDHTAKDVRWRSWTVSFCFTQQLLG
jgi:hypothetical protein